MGRVPKETVVGAQGHACASCNEMNARKTLYTTIVPEQRDQFPNRVFHADLLHVSKPDHAGHLYILAILDKFTRYAFVRGLVSKNQAMSSLRA